MDAPSAPSTAQWYVIQTKPRQEERAMEHLRNQLFPCYCPYHQAEKISRGKRVRVELPLFPGYLFIHLSASADNWHSIRSTRGVVRLVAFADQPLAVPDTIIEHLRSQLTEQGDQPLFAAGTQVTITDGPFKDLDAIFSKTDGEERAIILLNLLQRQQALTVPISQIRAADA